VKCTQNEEYCEAKVRRGEWSTKVISVTREMGCHPRKSIEDVAQIHPRMIREELAREASLHLTGADIRAPGMAPALLSTIFQFAEL
jgi:hypothetical protein